MDPTTRSLIAALDSLSRTARVALGCAAIEHLLDLYKLGNLKYRVSDVDEDLDAPPDRDLIDLGLELAWGFVTHGTNDKNRIQPIVDMLEARPDLEKPTHWSLAANGPVFGVIDTLQAIEDEGRRSIGFALSRSRGGVFEIASDFDPDEDAPAREQAQELGWQLKAAQLLVAHGNAKITRDTFKTLLAEDLPWRRYLPQYAAKYAAAVPAAGTKPAKPAAKKSASPSKSAPAKKPSSKPASKSAPAKKAAAKPASKAPAKKKKR